MTYPYFNRQFEYWGMGLDGEFAFMNRIEAVKAIGPGVSDDERDILNRLRGQILAKAKTNKDKQLYYEAKQQVKDLEIAVPPNLRDIGTAVGWAGTAVDAIDERIDFLAWTREDGNLNGLDEAFEDNNLAVESNYGHVDSLTTGVSFVSVGNDDEEDRQVIAIESSSSATVIWDYRKRRSFAGLSQTLDENGHILMETLYLENANLFFARESVSDPLELVNRDDHNAGRCFMTRLPNRARPFQMDGRSEITRAVRYYTDAAVRTMLGMEINREFYTTPQRFILNAYPSDFGVTSNMSEEEKVARGVSVASGMINIVPPRPDNDEGDPPSVVEMKPAPPTPYIEQIKAYSIQMAAETGLPATLFGFVTDNPTSADAIVKSEFRLTRKASRRIGSLGQGWKEVALLTLLARDGDVDRDFMRGVKCKFANPMLPTPAATADEIQKMIASNVLVPDSSVTYDLYGRLDEQQIRQLTQDKQKFEAKQKRQALEEAQRQIAVTQQTAEATAQARANNPTNNGAPSPQRRPAQEAGAR